MCLNWTDKLIDGQDWIIGPLEKFQGPIKLNFKFSLIVFLELIITDLFKFEFVDTWFTWLSVPELLLPWWLFLSEVEETFESSKYILEFDKAHWNTCLVQITAHLELFDHFMAVLRPILDHFFLYKSTSKRNNFGKISCGGKIVKSNELLRRTNLSLLKIINRRLAGL